MGSHLSLYCWAASLIYGPYQAPGHFEFPTPPLKVTLPQNFYLSLASAHRDIHLKPRDRGKEEEEEGCPRNLFRFLFLFPFLLSSLIGNLIQTRILQCSLEASQVCPGNDRL